MQFTIPANTPDYKYGGTFREFCTWLTVNGVDPTFVDGSQVLTVTGIMISGTHKGFGQFQVVDYPLAMPKDLADRMTNLFFTDPGPVDESAVALDDVAQLVRQLAEGREEAAAGKKKADEAKDQIMARLRQAGKEYGAVNGQRVLHAKTVEKNYFDKATFSEEHRDLAEKYTSKRAETRLELLP